MVKAQSAPGTMISSMATPQKAAIEPTAMDASSPDRGNWKKDIPDQAEEVSKYHCSYYEKWKNLFMDAIDREILAALQQDGRLTITELAARVGLSVSPCHRRL